MIYKHIYIYIRNQKKNIHEYSSFFIIKLPSWELSRIPYLLGGTFEDDDEEEEEDDDDDDDDDCPVWWDILLFLEVVSKYTLIN